MRFSLLASSTLTASCALGAGILRFGCSQITIERLDPLVEPGANPSAHLHQVVGGNAFKASIERTDVSKLADCTTCSFSEDLSNYWTANLFFRARNGTFKRVPQMPNRFLDGSVGGVTVYYFPQDLRTRVTTFKPGFRMLVGDATLRTKEGQSPRNCYRCFTGPNFEGDNLAPCADPKLDTPGLPSTPCPGGIRSNIHFPTCWDGENLDTPNHKDHVAWPPGNAYQCPSTHPVKIPQVMLEVVWDTREFNNPDEWPEDGSQPFVLSTGDPTGYSQHGDYVFGWKGDALQRAMDSNDCFAANCPTLETQSFEVANKCAIPRTVDEPVDGWLDSLPGMSM
ncbi:hypothetical protein GGS23DRAFT_438939 [Durotheca rogersii]|uniref:uncharacterized protein n=1 Tax=Durotheca rogersii TaxID=419775 RepID=UPI0022204B41|nr:uncharacterized protein GGS23DRAFT_438939 [Durotheca rogersii]KAI5856165.1 hypothetical protein GGS23DRAFT_438939 [Durotheca rogersii]